MTTGVALHVLDMQNDILGFQPDKAKVQEVVATIGHMASWARKAKIPVIYSRVAYRSTYIDTLPQLPAIKEYRMLDETQSGSAVIDELAPQDGDIVIVKRRINAFYNTDLELVLRALKVNTLLYTGISTARVVESTARAASDRDFRNIVVSDACSADTPEKHQNALDSIADFFGEVTSAQEAIRTLA